jgi:ADP-ribosylglycohydrolase
MTITVDGENFMRAETDRMFAGLQYAYDLVGASTETTESLPAAIALSGYASIPADSIDTLNEVNERSLQPLAAQLPSFRQLPTGRSGR